MCSHQQLFLDPLLQYINPYLPLFFNHPSLLFIHANNLAAGTQNFTCLQALVNITLTWQSSCVIANNAQKQQKLFVQGYTLKVHDVIKYTLKHLPL